MLRDAHVIQLPRGILSEAQGHAGRGSSSACYANKLSIDYASPASFHLASRHIQCHFNHSSSLTLSLFIVLCLTHTFSLFHSLPFCSSCGIFCSPPTNVAFASRFCYYKYPVSAYCWHDVHIVKLFSYLHRIFKLYLLEKLITIIIEGTIEYVIQ